MIAEVGELWATCTHDDRGDHVGLRVDRADPVIRITQQLVDLLSDPDWRHRLVEFDGQVIKIDAVNGRFIYELRGRDPHHPDCWIASWPD